MMEKIVISGLALGLGLWCLLFSERLQRRITIVHEDLKRSSHASQLFLRVSSLNFEVFLRVAGVFLILVFAGLAAWIAFELENYK